MTRTKPFLSGLTHLFTSRASGNRTRTRCDHCALFDREREMEIARQALAKNDVRHAAHHAAGALALDPNHPESLQLVDSLIAWRPKPKPFAGLARMLGADKNVEIRAPAFPEHPWWGNHLVRVRAAWLEGAHDEALTALIQVAATAAHLDLSTWWNRILDEAEMHGTKVSAGALLMVFGKLVNGTIGIMHLRPGEQAFFLRWAALGMRLQKHVNRDHQAMLTVATSGLLRRAGRFMDAAQLARQALEHVRPEDEQVNLNIQVGLALRGAGQFREAVEAFTAAGVERDPNHGLEIGRVHADAGHVDEAISAFENYGSGEDGEVAAMAALLRRQRGDEVDARCQSLAALLDAPTAPPTYDDLRRLFSGHTSPDLIPADASTNLLFKHPEMSLKGGSVAVTNLESPTVRMVLALAACGRPDPAAFNYKAENVPEPDPANPLDPDVGVRLWWRKDDAVVQAVPAPREETRDVIRPLAVRDIVTNRAWKHAQAVAARVDPEEVLRALVHPDPVPAGHDILVPDWVFRWQRTGCLLLAAHDLAVPWAVSKRRTLLRSVLFSHPDWTTAAALMALLEAALDDPAAADDARAWCACLSRMTPSLGHCSWAKAMQRISVVLPGMPPDLLTPLKEWLQAEDDNGGQGSDQEE